MTDLIHTVDYLTENPHLPLVCLLASWLQRLTLTPTSTAAVS